MCENCWKERGSKTNDGEVIRRVAKLVNELYEIEPVGGPWHIVTDDWNIESHHVSFCVERVKNREHFVSTNVADRAVAIRISDELAELFPVMSESERSSALALARGYWSIDV